MVSDRLKFVHGHTGYVFMPFPHLCPGCPCAIAAWLADVYARKQFEQLTPKDSAMEIQQAQQLAWDGFNRASADYGVALGEYGICADEIARTRQRILLLKALMAVDGRLVALPDLSVPKRKRAPSRR